MIPCRIACTRIHKFKLCGLEIVILGRDEPMWIAIHMCMEAMLGISLYSYLYLKLAKTLCLSYFLLCFLFNKIREEEGRRDSSQKRGLRGRWHKQCKHM
jgi:hypothetical protein